MKRFSLGGVAIHLLSLGLAFTAHAAEPPSLDAFFPAGGRRDTTNIIAALGKFPAWPAEFWCASPELQIQPLSTNGSIQITVSAQAALGAHWVRAITPDGASDPRLFVVGALPEENEIEPNDRLQSAQRLGSFPRTINGRWNQNGDIDAYALTLRAGDRLVAALESYVLDAPADPVIHLLDSQGNALAFSHDGRRLDPFLTFQAPSEGTYILQVSAFAHPPQADVRFTGGPNALYRLTVTLAPFAFGVFPPVRTSSTPAPEFVGWNLPTDQQSLRSAWAAPFTNTASEWRIESDQLIARALILDAATLPIILEQEPNNTTNTALPFTTPACLSGRIQCAADRDVFRIHLKKAQTLEIACFAAELGFPLDPLLELSDAAGNRVARHDDENARFDPQFTWTAPADGTFYFSIEDLMGRGTPESVYTLRITPVAPDFSATLSAHHVRLEAGKTNELPIAFARRHGFTNPVLFSISNLPPGVTSRSVTVDGKNEAKIELVAAADVSPTNLPLRVFAALAAPDSPQARLVPAPIKGKTTEPGDLLLNEIDTLWLTILPSRP